MAPGRLFKPPEMAAANPLRKGFQHEKGSSSRAGARRGWRGQNPQESGQAPGKGKDSSGGNTQGLRSREVFRGSPHGQAQTGFLNQEEEDGSRSGLRPWPPG